MENFVFGVLGAILYPLFGVIFLCIEGIQSIFFAFAGIGEMSFGGSVVLKDQLDSDGGIVYFLFQHLVVKNMLMSIMLLALFLIIIFTVMAFIKNAYSAKPKGWKEIIGNSIKGLANFIFIPVCCLLGVWLGNILLQAINGATSKGSIEMSRTLFIASAYNANQFRTGEFGADKWDELKAFAEKQTVSGTSNKYDASYIKEGMTTEELANALDDVYANTNVSYHLQSHISDWYNVGLVNYIVLAVGGVFILYVLCSLAFAMVRRLFLLLILFIISPGVCAMYPLDEGKAVGSWKTKFFEQVVSAYGAVAGLNIFFSLIPIIGKIELFSGPLAGFMNCIVQIFILVSGLLVVNEFISLISGFVGGEDAYSKGKSTMSSSLSKVKGTVSKTTGVFATAAGAKAGGGSFFGSLLKQGADAAGGVFGISGKDMKKAYKEGKDNFEKEGKEKEEARKKREADRKELAEKYGGGFKGLALGTFANAGAGLASEVGFKFKSKKRLQKDEDDYNKRMQALLAAGDTEGAQALSRMRAKQLNQDMGSLFGGNRRRIRQNHGEELSVLGAMEESVSGVATSAEDEYKKASETYTLGKKLTKEEKKLTRIMQDRNSYMNTAKLSLTTTDATGKKLTKKLDETATAQNILDALFEKIKNKQFAGVTGKGSEMLKTDVLEAKAIAGEKFTGEDISKADKNVAAKMKEFNAALDFKDSTDTLKETVDEIATAVKEAGEKISGVKPDMSGLEDAIKDVSKNITKDAKKFSDDMTEIMNDLKAVKSKPKK